MDLDKLRELCMSFPGATEGIKWEDHICFMVAEKMFCVTGEQGGANLKVTPEEFEELTQRDGIVPAAYMARNMWVSIQKWNALKPKEWEHYVRQSYELIRSKLPKKVQHSL
ncbi:MAG: MmcQ/YjbR family DNA-binding protein [Bacteroidota bacterium]